MDNMVVRRARTVLEDYWARAWHCCDPDETVAEMLAALDEAGYEITRKDSELCGSSRGCIRGCT